MLENIVFQTYPRNKTLFFVYCFRSKNRQIERSMIIEQKKVEIRLFSTKPKNDEKPLKENSSHSKRNKEKRTKKEEL